MYLQYYCAVGKRNMYSRISSCELCANYQSFDLITFEPNLFVCF